MYWTERHVFVCTGNHCSQKGANKVLTRLRFELMRRRLTTKIMINNCGTIDLCDIGPNIIVYPDNLVYSNVTENDIPEIVKFLEGGEVVDRLVTDADAPAEVNRRAFFSALLEQGNSASQEDAHALAAAQELDDRWIAEQLRRGFMAKKPDKESGEERFSMTSKAQHRYRL